MGKTTTVLLLVTLALPAPIASARVLKPPGNSEADQYFETIPGAAGPTTPNTSKTAEDAVREGKLSGETLRALEQRGTSGKALANAVAQTAPPQAGKSGGKAGASSESNNVRFEAPDERSMGIFFPLILIATGVAAAAYLVDRRRRPTAK
jgi:hypothetical protein